MNLEDDGKIERALDRDNESPDSTPGESLQADESLGYSKVVRSLRSRSIGAHKQVSHLSLSQLRAYAADRKAQAGEWEMPEHLAACPVCLDAYEVMLEGEMVPTPRAKSRFETIFASRLALDFRENPFTVFRRRSWHRVASLAAVLLVAVGVVWMATNLITPSTTATVTQGALATVDGQAIPVGSVIPAGKTVLANQAVQTTFADGSAVEIQEHSRFSVVKSYQGSTTLDLASGSVEAHVAKQSPGNHFFVNTALGKVIVVGTRFSVTCSNDSVRVYPNGVKPDKSAVATDGASAAASTADEGRVTAVTVRVTEGVINVQNNFETVRVGAGQAAFLRENQSHIEVVGDAAN